MRPNPRSGIFSLVLAEIKDGSPDPRVIEDFRGFELMSDLPDQYPVVFPMSSDALEFAVHLGCKYRDQMKVVVITKQMELTGDRFDGAALQFATAMLCKTNPGRVMVSVATVDILDEDLDRDYSLIPVGRLELDDGKGVSMFKMLHAGFATDHSPDFIKELTNLPRWGGRFVGRKSELAQISDRMLLSRTTALIGATGIGKSRLAIEYGSQILAEQPGGVWYVDLRYAPGNPRLLEDHIAKKLKLKGAFELTPMERIVEFLGGPGTTLILDACESAVNPIAAFVEDLVAQCPNLQVLLATQQPLPITSVAIYRVPPMRPESEDGELSDAVQLFVSRAELYDENFEPNERDLEEIAGLCENLAGVPLAIELAAAAYVNQGQVDTTRGTDRSATNNVLGWIGKNLDRNEKRLAEACAFFRGPIETEHVQKLAAETSSKEIRTLCNWAVLRVDGEQNVRMPRGVQAYFGNVSKTRRTELAEAHAACFTEAALDWEKENRLDKFARHADDCHEALAWACTNNQSQRAIDLVYALFDFWFRFGRFDEGLGWCERALEACADHELMLARIYNMMCGLARGKADMKASIAYADLGIELALKNKEKPILTRLYLQAGSALWALQEYERGLAAFAECRKCSKSLQIEYGILICDLYSASLRAEKGEIKRAETGFAKLRAKELPADLKTILDLHEGALHLMEGQLLEARELLEQAFVEFHEEGNTVGCMSAMRMLVPCLAKSGLAYIAAWIDGMLDRLNQEVHLYWHEPQRVLYQNAVDEIRKTLGQGVYLDQFEHGQFTTRDEFKKFLTKESFLSGMD